MSDIRVRGPDGRVVIFPAGTSEETMRNALHSYYGGGRQQSRPEAFRRNAVDSLTLGRADEWSGAFARGSVGDLGGMLRGIERNMPLSFLTPGLSDEQIERLNARERELGIRTPLNDPAVRARGDEAESRATERSRGDLAAAQFQHPVSSIAGSITGALPLGAVGGGAAAPVRAIGGAVTGAGRGLLALGRGGRAAAPAAAARSRDAAGRFVAGAAAGRAATPATNAATTAAAEVAPRFAPTLARRIGAAMGAGGAFGGAHGYNSGRDGERLETGLRGARDGALWGGGLAGASGVLGRAMRINNPRVQAAATGGLLGAGTAAGTYAITGDMGLTPQQRTEAALMAGALGLGVGASGAGIRRALTRNRPEENVMGRLARRSNLTVQQLDERIAAAQKTNQGRVFADILGRPAQRRGRTLAEMPGETLEIAAARMNERMANQGERIGQAISRQARRPAMDALSERVEKASAKLLTPVMRAVTPEGRGRASQTLADLQRRPTVRGAMQAAQEMVEEDVAAGRLASTAMDDPVQMLHALKIVLQAQARDPMTLGRNSLGLIDNAQLVAASNAVSDTLEAVAPGYANAMAQLQRLIVPREIMRTVENAQRGDVVNVAGAALRNPQVRRSIAQRPYRRIGDMLRQEDELYQSARRMMPDSGSQTTPMAMDVMDQLATENVPLSLQGWLDRAARHMMAGPRESVRNQLGAALYEPVDRGLSDFNPERIAAARAWLLRDMQRRAAAGRNQIGDAASGAVGVMDQSE